MKDLRDTFRDMTPDEMRKASREASIEVKDIRYFGSQTWPFPSNIMIGFRAEYASGELTPDGEEVVESGWFARSPGRKKTGSALRTQQKTRRCLNTPMFAAIWSASDCPNTSKASTRRAGIFTL